jgi:SAM-dependent methyltransferase
MPTTCYDFDWHVRHRSDNDHSAQRVIELVQRELTVRSVVDFGCGDGIWLKKFAEAGAAQVLGYDGPWTDVDRLLINPSNFQSADFRMPIKAPRLFDLAVCLEVAEHVPADAAEILVRSICGHSQVVLFSAAVPGQGGYRHINERWQSYWAALFDVLGYRRFDYIRAEIWDDPHVHFWYKQNIALFVSEQASQVLSQLIASIGSRRLSAMPVDIVHPTLFASVAEYNQIAFKPLARKLLPSALNKARSVLRERIFSSSS